MTQQPLGVQISKMLKDRGVGTVFGIPGVHNVELYRGIEQAGITHILARHEQGAGFMADGYARATGKPGVAYVISGPGLTNILTPMGQAYSDSVPMLVVSSCLDETAATRGQLHQMRDQRAAAETVCAWSEEARSASAAYALIDRALDQFASARNRPCHVQVPIDLLGTQADPAPAAPEDRPTRPAARHDDVYTVADRVLAARKPIFVFGGGAVAGADAVPAVLRQTGAASFVTYAARGLVPPDTQLYFGSYLARPDSARVLAEADLVVAVGTTLSEVDLWRSELGHMAPMIRVDIDPECFAGLGPEDHAILADAGELLRAMSIAIPARTDDRPAKWDTATVVRQRNVWRAEVNAERPGIVLVCDALRAVLPDDTMIYSDMTQFAYAAKEVWDMPRPCHWHHPYGFGTLGYALPAAIGGAVARPGLPTLAVAGDYGLQYTIQELGTAVELGLPLPILVWDNGKLGEIEDSMVRSQIAPNAVVARNPDFLALARAYGADATQPDTLEDVQSAVLAAFEANRPTLIRLKPDLTA
ncbi:5-guanidino-2-oxopentanoate decarboxylase [Marivita hallyeonensis]|uniref:Acetolactate synthase-1/2/3 large subunit/5-guanidino-2-oxopentanoate decarboxylase n=1 Tax=Marivita hallyeonensis TaxID=996342 RepID=A0A1M5PAT1_9RHOB|nr:5-guanidino-2-oxopentanoate decarboxylase [Marivita hallyeonensis]SHG98343.1 acetolactate synthase-1/2/3 large subunit/5-guanidino-2-oxopentanoate decarboxylase [Marivita hallyeonensis]